MKKGVSIFDFSRITYELGDPLAWNYKSSYIQINPDSYICESNLYEVHLNGAIEFAHYILTREMLIKCKLNENCVESNLFENSAGNYSMLLYFPLLKKIKINGNYGFKITSGKTQKKFLVESKEEIEIWYNGLKEICILENFEKKYTFEGDLGSGYSSIVKLAKNNKTGAKYAVKCLSVDWLKKSQNAIV